MQASKRVFPMAAHVEKGPEENIMSSCFKGPEKISLLLNVIPLTPVPARNWVQDLTNQGLVAVVLVYVNRDLWYRGHPIT